MARSISAIYYVSICIDASSPEKAYVLGRQLFENDDFKELTVTDWFLEHVSIGDKYWYKEDLKL